MSDEVRGPGPTEPTWLRRYPRLLVAVDIVAVAIAVLVARFLRFGFEEAELTIDSLQVPYLVVALAMIPIWLAIMAGGGGYDRRVLGAGSEEYRRVLSAGAHFLALIAIVHFVFKLSLARGFIGAMVPLAVVLTVVGRHVVRRRIHRLRNSGRWMHRVLLAGSPESVRELTRHLRRNAWAGLEVIGACVPASATVERVADIDVVGTTDDVALALQASRADVLAVTSELPPGELRRLAWSLEGTSVQLLVAPAITDVAGPRVAVQPVAGLPLLHVDRPKLSGARLAVKESADRIVAALVLTVLSPLLVAMAAAVKATSPGPVLFRQRRVGRDGREFEVLKFRTMVDGAEDDVASLLDRNDAVGPLFKLRHDPRVTPLGRVLRRWSLDELPQFVNVVRGEMSIVGPRPPLPHEVELYSSDMHRRLLVKPGITGLWQISGRSELPWDEAVRLDLYYVDHWSLAMDVAIVGKTLSAVLRGRGAF